MQPGARLGPYEIQSAIGAGGMGEIYRARDTRLDRTVAIKVLPAQFAADPQSRERFEREARAISQLNHPHICTLHDIGNQDGTDFLVMEYLEGETLADRLAKGALPLDQALQCAIQIADALDKAHRKGITHRDLKPGNIFLCSRGPTPARARHTADAGGAGRGRYADESVNAKLLDFGLAKLRAATTSAIEGVSAAPTVSSPFGAAQGGPLTGQGTILGTLQYMAPEQLEGKDAEARTDIFAFGAVVYEMLTGKRAFEGKSQASLISAIMSADPPPIASLQPLAPALLDHVVKRCLAKDPDERWQSASDVKLQLVWVAESGPVTAAAPVVHKSSRERIAWTVAGLALVVLVGAGTTLLTRRAPSAQEIEPSEFVILPPEKASFGSDVESYAISPDGRRLVFVASGADGTSVLWVRPLDSLTARPLAGTDEARGPFWSPDGRYIGFFARGKLKTIDVAGGPAQTLADASSLSTGGTWNREGVIVFGPGLSSPLFRVPAGGGTATPVTSLDQPRHADFHENPFFLPDGRHFLFLAVNLAQTDDQGVYVGSLDSKDVKPLLRGNSTVAYSPPGYLLFMRESTLMAQPFDVARLSTTGDAVPVAERVARFLNIGGFAVSESGTLVYRPATALQTQLVWVDRTGRPIGIAAPPAAYLDVALAPDDKRVVFSRFGPTGGMDVWLMDLQRRITSRFTFQPPVNNVPVWSPDGRTVAFASARNGGLDIYQRPSNASGPDEPLLKLNAPPIVFPSDWSSDGRFLAYYRGDPKTQLDIWVLPLVEERKPFPFLHAEFNESQAQFSPDGRWMAYQSDESGSPQIYVQSFPTLTGKWQISASGGSQPRWRRDGKELFYLAPDRKLMAVMVKPGAIFEAEGPRALFETALPVAELRQTYAVSADGQRFLMNAPLDAGSPPMTIVLNWTAGLKK